MNLQPPTPPPSPPSCPPWGGAVEIELRFLDRAYRHLRVREPRAVARHVAAMVDEQWPRPVLTVAREGGRYALIEGDEQVDALARLGRDTVPALVLGLTEAEALSYCYRMQGEQRRSALEEGWLVAELLDHGHELSQIGAVLGRSVSWVSRRLGLARQLPEKAAEVVRNGKVAAHAAMRSLLPLARANKGHCETLCEHLGQTPVSSRQLDGLYTAWRRGDPELRERLVQSPLLFMKAKEALPPKLPEGTTSALVRELEQAQKALIRAADALARAWSSDLTALSTPLVESAVGRCTDAYEQMLRYAEEDPSAR